MSSDKPMKLWLLKNPAIVGWLAYESAVVAALDEQSARLIHPGGGLSGCWCSSDEVIVEHIGEAASNILEGTIICSSNAGA